jgi:hypothetical protein
VIDIRTTIILGVTLGLSSISAFATVAAPSTREAYVKAQVEIVNNCHANERNESCLFARILLTNLNADKAICIAESEFPYDGGVAGDTFYLTTKSGTRVQYNGPSEIVLRNYDRSELVYVFPPSVTGTSIVRFTRNYRLAAGTYKAHFEASGKFCELYNYGTSDFVSDKDEALSNRLMFLIEAHSQYFIPK